jgi:hypothetical protein
MVFMADNLVRALKVCQLASCSSWPPRGHSLTCHLQSRGLVYRTSHVLVPFGDDFKFRNAQLQYSNMDQLIGESAGWAFAV